MGIKGPKGEVGPEGPQGRQGKDYLHKVENFVNPDKTISIISISRPHVENIALMKFVAAEIISTLYFLMFFTILTKTVWKWMSSMR